LHERQRQISLFDVVLFDVVLVDFVLFDDTVRDGVGYVSALDLFRLIKRFNVLRNDTCDVVEACVIPLASVGCRLPRGAKRRVEQEPQPRGRALRRLWSHERLLLGRLRIEGEKLLQQRVGVEADRLRVGAYVGATEDALGPPREVVGFEAFEQRDLDLGLRRNVLERDLALFTLLAKPRTKTRFDSNNLRSIVRTVRVVSVVWIVRSFSRSLRSIVPSFGHSVLKWLSNVEALQNGERPNRLERSERFERFVTQWGATPRHLRRGSSDAARVKHVTSSESNKMYHAVQDETRPGAVM